MKRAARQLFGYFLVGLMLLLTPLGWYFLWHLFFIFKRPYSFNLWFAIDVLVCTICHKTKRRTLSGWTGQFMHSKERYRHQAKFIDWLFVKLGDKPEHCHRAFLKEKKLGFVN